MSIDTAQVRLRPATAADWPLLSRWIARPDIQAWWGPPATIEAEIRTVLASFSALCRVIELDDIPAGYAHAIDARLWGEELPDDMPPGTWDADVMIGEPALRGRGVGAAAMLQLADDVFATTLATAISVFVSVRNEVAVRAYENAGFRWRRVWHDPVHGPEWLMVRERKSL